MQCGILKLGDLVALAKYEGMQSIVGQGYSPGKGPQANNKTEKHKNGRTKAEQKRDTTKVASWWKRQLKAVTATSLTDASQRIANTGSTTVADETEAENDIPYFFRRYTEKYPFGNVHMSLRVGPLVIENGVEQ